jgi:hypothetical protein
MFEQSPGMRHMIAVIDSNIGLIEILKCGGRAQVGLVVEVESSVIVMLKPLKQIEPGGTPPG